MKEDRTGFQDKVLSLVKRIPVGKVTTYKILAEKLNTRAYRLVGQALKKNPQGAWGKAGGKSFRRKRNIIPCHRVICSDGSLGGYCGQLNSRKKLQLLKKEGIKFRKDHILDFKDRLFFF